MIISSDFDRDFSGNNYHVRIQEKHLSFKDWINT